MFFKWLWRSPHKNWPAYVLRRKSVLEVVFMDCMFAVALQPSFNFPNVLCHINLETALAGSPVNKNALHGCSASICMCV